jgi:hypothetical protein
VSHDNDEGNFQGSAVQCGERCLCVKHNLQEAIYKVYSFIWIVLHINGQTYSGTDRNMGIKRCKNSKHNYDTSITGKQNVHCFNLSLEHISVAIDKH